jgi:hypothetical protein
MRSFAGIHDVFTIRIMRVHTILPIAVLTLAAVLNAKKTVESIEQRLQWARETIDAHAMTHHFEPPARSSGTKWQVTRIEGCTMELKESAHREAPDSILTGENVFGLSEDKVVTWTFNLAHLLPQFIVAETDGVPHLTISSQGDAFHFTTEEVSRTLSKDGTTVSTRNWSAPGNAPNLWIYFDSPDADNSSLVKRLEHDLRDAASRCASEASAHDHHRWW